jgi:hypothetical protein
MDQAPGPKTASPKAIAAASKCASRPLVSVNAVQISIPPAMPANIAVQSPAASSAPAIHRIADSQISPFEREPVAKLRAIKKVESAKRKSNSPRPGQPFANVEYRRCTDLHHDRTVPPHAPASLEGFNGGALSSEFRCEM